MLCNDCDQEFDSAVDLFIHRARHHTPVVALQPVPSKRKLEDNWKDERIDKRPRHTQRKRIDYSRPSSPVAGPSRRRSRSLSPIPREKSRSISPTNWRDDRINSNPRNKQRKRINYSPGSSRKRSRSLSPAPSPANWRDERIDSKPRGKQRKRINYSPSPSRRSPTPTPSPSPSPSPVNWEDGRIDSKPRGKQRKRINYSPGPSRSPSPAPSSLGSVRDIPLPDSPPPSPRGRKRPPESPDPPRKRHFASSTYTNNRLQYYKTRVRSLTAKLAHVQGKVRTLEKRYNNKLKECKENLERYQETIELLQKQREEFETNFNDPNFNAFSAAIINSASIKDFLKIKDLIAQNKFDDVLRSKKLLISLQKLFIGMRYGVVPIVVPQRNMLTDADRDIIKGLENVSLERVKSTIREKKGEFMHIFSVIADTINFLEVANQHRDE